MPKHKDIKKILVIGSGPIVIGQAAEFDYAGTQACLALKEEGIEVVLVNSNPATIMTDEMIADHIYIEPLTVNTIEKIIEKEKPDGLIGTLGGQTGLNLTVELYESGILDKHCVQLLGTTVPSIQKGEDREKFRNLMLQIGEPVPESAIIEDYEAGIKFVQEIGYPVIIRPAYTLGGAGGGFATNEEELQTILTRGLSLSPIHQVLVEKSIKGWKEVEYEVMRDANDTCTIVCNMENMDPVGVHTGDSIVVAPSQTLSDVQYQMLRDASLKVIRALEVVGGCNIQFALHPSSNDYYIIEVNPRVSRSSALASKATGYPIARIATKCAIGYHLDEILNPITGNTFASFEPALDYIVVKLPRFPFDKFSEGDRTLATQMKATGEVMAIDRSFEGALNKALRSLEMNVHSLHKKELSRYTNEALHAILKEPTDLRLFAIAEAFTRGSSIDKIHEITEIDRWYLKKIINMLNVEQRLAQFSWASAPAEDLMKAKRMNMSDQRIAEIFDIPDKQVREKWKQLNIKRGYKLVDTCAAEFDAVTPYFYSTWQGNDEVIVQHDRPKILVIGSGPIRIGQGIEFDYCSVHAALAIQKKGYEAVVINNNPETVSTDYSIADRLYFEPLAAEDILAVIEKEQVEGVLIQFGGQTAINIAAALEEEGIRILGTSIRAIDQLEDRDHFYELLKQLKIPHILGLTANCVEQLFVKAEELGYPVLIRPSYVIGGQSMYIRYNEHELKQYVERLTEWDDQRTWPLLVDKYLPGLESEIDVISDGESIVIPGIFEHIEKAGVHSGDSAALFPPATLTEKTKQTMVHYAEKIADALPVIGMMNIQFVIHDETVYVLEVNPRSSRTVPIMSKLTGIPMVEWATHVQLGDSLLQLSKHTGLYPEPPYYSLKLPIFSAEKLKGVDHVLGPEMKSTGEVLTLGLTEEESLRKAFEPFMNNNDIVFCSIADRSKEQSLDVIQRLFSKGYQIVATEGTASFLRKHRIAAIDVKNEEAALHECFKNMKLSFVFNVPSQGRDSEKTGFYIRELAVRYQIPSFTSIDTMRTLVDLLTNESGNRPSKPRSLREYHDTWIKSEVEA
ncbi:carbamoyl-phosphate synthase (glutamine-hydrolyzing) large subunit [Evansella halocellulosilytica]|uniref:carbamoyl-phosphate synthase (glutamine-hydrolyzing) large subunit n=1 Tax=Evansella halocellulosilytica TaxID=2011013 RepID=UPI000BB6C920|nr:carbamoyl-phosphate synthase (glutamine-hydrolyzing) large subunit [Evansella halocellulosilytica]